MSSLKCPAAGAAAWSSRSDSDSDVESDGDLFNHPWKTAAQLQAEEARRQKNQARTSAPFVQPSPPQALGSSATARAVTDSTVEEVDLTGKKPPVVARAAQPQPQQHHQQRQQPQSHPQQHAQLATMDPLPTPHLWVSTVDAKQQFSLAPTDLARLRCELRGGGFGCGAPSKFYCSADLLRAANAKHAAAGFLEKREARFKRGQNKRKREDGAAAAACTARANRSIGGAAAAVPIDMVAESVAKSLRPALLKLAKKAMGFKGSGGPLDIRVEVPGITPATFALLRGVPSDPALATMVKRGAFYSEQVSLCDMFGRNANLSRFFARDGVGQKLLDAATLKYKPSTMALTLHAYAEITL